MPSTFLLSPEPVMFLLLLYLSDLIFISTATFSSHPVQVITKVIILTLSPNLCFLLCPFHPSEDHQKYSSERQICLIFLPFSHTFNHSPLFLYRMTSKLHEMRNVMSSTIWPQPPDVYCYMYPTLQPY